MLNQVILVGRLKGEIYWITDNHAIFTLAIPRNYKNADGEYSTDTVRIQMFDNIAKSTSDYCHSGDIIGIKGRIEGDENSSTVVAEKITFLSSHKQEDDNEDE